MNNMQDDFIQYIGIDSKINEDIETFTQFNTCSNFYIPKNKKDILQINKVHASSHIIESQIIKTPIGKSYEGQILTGNKLYIDFEIKVKIEYMCNDDNHSLQYIHHSIPSSAYVVIDEDYDDCLSAYPSIMIEDIYCKVLNERKVYLNISLISAVSIF